MLFVKQSYRKIVVPLQHDSNHTAKMLSLGIAQTSLSLLSLNRIFAAGNEKRVLRKLKTSFHFQISRKRFNRRRYSATPQQNKQA